MKKGSPGNTRDYEELIQQNDIGDLDIATAAVTVAIDVVIKGGSRVILHY